MFVSIRTIGHLLERDTFFYLQVRPYAGPAEGEGLGGLQPPPPHFFGNFKELLRKRCFQPPHCESLFSPPTFKVALRALCERVRPCLSARMAYRDGPKSLTGFNLSATSAKKQTDIRYWAQHAMLHVVGQQHSVSLRGPFCRECAVTQTKYRFAPFVIMSAY